MELLLLLITIFGLFVFGMAKVDGPLFSLEARGQIGNGIVFFPWKGRHVVRRWLKPTNPQSALQGYVRVALKLIGKAIAEIVDASVLQTAALAKAPAGMNWNAYHAKGFLDLCVAANTFDTAAFTDLITAWSALDETTFPWGSVATGLSLVDFTFGYGYTTPVVAGFQLYACALAAYENAVSWGTQYTTDPISFATTDITAFAAAFTA